MWCARSSASSDPSAPPNWTLLAAVAFSLGFAALEAIFLPSRLSAHDKATLDGVRVSLGGSHLSQIAFGVLGVLVITSEYTSGMIRATLTGGPSTIPRARRQGPRVHGDRARRRHRRQLPVPTSPSRALLSGDALRSSLSDPGVVRALIGGGLYLAVLGLLGLGLGAILRASSGAIAALFSLLFVPQILVELLPETWKTTLGRYAPWRPGARSSPSTTRPAPSVPWAGLGVFCLYAVAALTAGFHPDQTGETPNAKRRHEAHHDLQALPAPSSLPTTKTSWSPNVQAHALSHGGPTLTRDHILRRFPPLQERAEQQS